MDEMHQQQSEENGKVQEKTVVRRGIMTIVTVIVCLAAMSFTAYAFFTYSVASSPTAIKTAVFETDATISVTDDLGQTVYITPVTKDHVTFKTDALEPGKYYTITLRPTGDSTAKTGFVIFSAQGCNETYHTQQLGTDIAAGGNTDAVTFTLMVTDKTVLTLQAHWGTSSYYGYQNNSQLYVKSGEAVKMIVNGHAEPVVEEVQETTPETTTPEETTPEETTELTTQPEETTAPAETTMPAETETTQPTEA